MDKTKMTVLMTALMIAAGSGVAMAKGPGGGERMTFETLDADGSGEITVEDFATLRDTRFGELDTDGDGMVSQAEYIAHAEAQATERAAERFAQLDADEDGVLSRDAIEARTRGGNGERMISRLDEDNSGGISAEEFEAAKDRMSKRRDRGDRDGRGRGDRRD
jgi:Ca2+-binding EF-hand superfamily protein